MQSGQFTTLPEVLQHYSKADPGPLGHNELNPLNLTDQEKVELEAFLKTLSSPPATDPKWLSPPQ
jgi:cytochrome c peroxidase